MMLSDQRLAFLCLIASLIGATVPIQGASFSALGKVTDVNGDGMQVQIHFSRVSGSGSVPSDTATDVFGNWMQGQFQTGTTYRVTPQKDGVTFTPTHRDFSSAGGEVTGLNFQSTQTYTISGYVKTGSGAGISGVSVLGVTTNSSGYFVKTGLTAGNYTVQPSKSGYTFDPTSQVLTVPPNRSNVNFTGTATVTDFSASGKVTDSNGQGMQAQIQFGRVSGSGSIPSNTATDVFGNWMQGQFKTGTTYRVTPQKDGVTFTPAYRDFTSTGGTVTDLDFQDTQTYTISGYVKTSSGQGIDGVSVLGVTTNSSGYYEKTGLTAGNFTVQPSKSGYTFEPASQVLIVPPTRSGVDFVGTSTPQPPTSPSIVITDIRVSPSQLTPGQAVALTVDTRNDGTGVGTAYVGVTVFDPSNNPCNLVWQSYDYPTPGSTHTFTFTYTAGSALGKYDVLARSWSTQVAGPDPGECQRDGKLADPHNEGLLKQDLFQVYRSLEPHISEITLDRIPARTSQRAFALASAEVSIPAPLVSVCNQGLHVLVTVTNPRDSDFTGWVGHTSLVEPDGNTHTIWGNEAKTAGMTLSARESASYIFPVYRTANPITNARPAVGTWKVGVTLDEGRTTLFSKTLDTVLLPLEVVSNDEATFSGPSPTFSDLVFMNDVVSWDPANGVLTVEFLQQFGSLLASLFAPVKPPPTPYYDYIRAQGSARTNLISAAQVSVEDMGRTSDQRSIQVAWMNGRYGTGGAAAGVVEVYYDRCITSLSMPPGVRVRDSGGGNVASAADSSQLITWTETKVDKLITSSLTYNGKYLLSIDEPCGKIELKAATYLLLGPFQGVPGADYNSLAAFPMIYNYAKWKSDPGNVYWCIIGNAATKTSVEGKGVDISYPAGSSISFEVLPESDRQQPLMQSVTITSNMTQTEVAWHAWTTESWIGLGQSAIAVRAMKAAGLVQEQSGILQPGQSADLAIVADVNDLAAGEHLGIVYLKVGDMERTIEVRVAVPDMTSGRETPGNPAGLCGGGLCGGGLFGSFLLSTVGLTVMKARRRQWFLDR